MRLALGSSQRPLLNTPPSRVAVSEDAEDNAYPPLSPLQRPSATPSQPPVHSPLQEFITPRETFTGATATQATEPSPANQLPASQPSGNGSSSSSDNSGSHPSQSPHGPGGNPGGDPASSSDGDGVPDDEADTGGPPDQPGGQPPSPPDSDDEPPPPPEEDESPPPPNFQGDVSDADSNDSERHVALMIGVGSVLSWQLPTEGSQLHCGSASHTKAWLLMMKSYIVNIKRDLAVEELWEQMMVQVYENSQPFVLFTDNRAAWIQGCNALQTQSSLNGVLQVNEHGQPIMNPATWKLKLLHFYDLVKTGLALALKVTPLDAKEEYEKFGCYDNAGLLYPMPRILMSEFTKKYEEFDIRAGQPHYREAMAKVAKLLDRMAPTLKENFGSYKDVTPLGCWAIAKLYKLDQDQHTLERLSGISQTEASKRDDMTAQGMLLCVSKPPTQRPTVMPRQTPAFPVTQDPSAPKGTPVHPKRRGNQPLQLEAPQTAQSDLQEPDWYNAALVVSFRQTPEAETQASSQAIYKPTFNPSTDGTGSTAAIPLPRARVSQHVTQAQHRASQDLLMDEMTVLRRDLDLLFREVQNLHEFNRALQVRATAVETAQRAACVMHNPVDTFVRDYTASGQLSPSTATLLQGTEPSYGVPYLANRSHQTGLSFTSATGLLQCVNLMVLVDTGSGLNFISQSMADSLGYDPLPCHHKTIAFNDVKSSLTKEIQMPVIFCSGTPNEISVRATFVIAPDNTIFDALIAPSPPLAPGRQLDTDLRLAAMSKDTDGLDIHSDQFVLEYLRRGVLGSNWTTSLPVEDWFCPNCKASGITAIPAGRIPEAPQKEPNLSPPRRLAPETEPPSPATKCLSSNKSESKAASTKLSGALPPSKDHCPGHGREESLALWNLCSLAQNLPDETASSRRGNQPLQLEAPQAAQSDLQEPDWYNAALVVSFRQTPEAETQASSQAIYKPTFNPSTNGTGSTAAIPPTHALEELQNLHEFNRALQVRATAVETAQRAACVMHNPVDTFVRDYTASGQLSPSTATLLQGTEPSYGVPGTPNEISVRATFVIAPDNTIFDASSRLAAHLSLHVSTERHSSGAYIDTNQAETSSITSSTSEQEEATWIGSPSAQRSLTPIRINARCSQPAPHFAHLSSGIGDNLGAPSPPRVPCTVPTRYIRSSPTGHNLDGRRENLLTTHHLTPTDDHNLLASSSRWRQVIQPRTKRYLTDMAASYPVNLGELPLCFPCAFYVTLLMHMVTHAHSMESYSYETNSDNTLYLGDVNLLHRCIQDLPAQDNFSSVLTWGKEQGLPIRVTLTPRIATPAPATTNLSKVSDTEELQCHQTRCINWYDTSAPSLHSTSIFLIRRPPIYNSEDDFDTPSPTSSTPAGDNYEEPQDFFTTQLDDVYWRPGAVLSQLGSEGNEYLVACASRSLNKHEAGYSSFKGEMLAACWACKIFRVYVFGLHFTLVTDHQPLLWMFSSANVTGAIARWACMLQSFDFDIMHRPGAQHGNADALSRFPSPTAEDNTGARIDLDSNLYAAFPTVPTTPYVPLDLTLGHIVDYVLDVRSVLSICTTPLPAAVTYMAQNGITLYEMCGGMCAGLEAALRNGIQVNSPPLAPGRQLDTDLRLAAMSKDTDGLDIHSDQFVLEYLRRGVLGSNWTTSRTRRVLARSRKYRLGASPTGEERIIRILATALNASSQPPARARGNTMLMHAVEYFSAALVVVPIPAKEAIHTVGDFVYIRRPNVRNSLQMAAQGMILRIIDLKPSEVVVLQGRCVPVEDWFCPNCKASSITAIPAGRIPEAPQKEPNLFPTPQTRSRDRAALACDKMLVIKQVRVQGGLDKAVWGTASFQGPLSRPW
eukprot:gene2400-biopygen6818